MAATAAVPKEATHGGRLRPWLLNCPPCILAPNNRAVVPRRVPPPHSAPHPGQALIGAATIWKRRPTRWLKGLDGVEDADVCLYVHEDNAEGELGGRYRGRPPRAVLGDAEFRRDVVAAGPRMGMTFTVTASRELELREARE